jgi:uncharacterized protein YigE (DUF2233 family)
MQKRTIRKVSLYAVKVNLEYADVFIQTPEDFHSPYNFSHESFQGLIRKSRPEAAINGIFYDTQNFSPIGDIYLYGQKVHAGWDIGTAFIITLDKKAMIKDVRWYKSDNWLNTRLVIVCGPRLVEDGQIVSNIIERARATGFRDNKIFAKTRRSALGIIDESHIIFVTTINKADVWTMAKIMRDLGCINAISLDGGSSSGIYYQGDLLVKPRREMTNIIVINNSNDINTTFAD